MEEVLKMIQKIDSSATPWIWSLASLHSSILLVELSSWKTAKLLIALSTLHYWKSLLLQYSTDSTYRGQTAQQNKLLAGKEYHSFIFVKRNVLLKSLVSDWSRDLHTRRCPLGIPVSMRRPFPCCYLSIANLSNMSDSEKYFKTFHCKDQFVRWHVFWRII